MSICRHLGICRRKDVPLLVLLIIGITLPIHGTWAANGDIMITHSRNGESWSLPVQTLVLLTSLTFLPAILLMMTGFTRIIIVLGLLRNALGTTSTPPIRFYWALHCLLHFT